MPLTGIAGSRLNIESRQSRRRHATVRPSLVVVTGLGIRVPIEIAQQRPVVIARLDRQSRTGDKTFGKRRLKRKLGRRQRAEAGYGANDVVIEIHKLIVRMMDH